MLSEEKRRVLQQKGPELLNVIDPSDMFLRYLKANGVIMHIDFSDLIAQKPSEKISWLLGHLERGPTERYEGFIQALRDTGQIQSLCLLEGSSEALQEPDSGDVQKPQFRAHRQYYRESLGNVPFSKSPAAACFDLEDVFTEPQFRRVGTLNKLKFLTWTEMLQYEDDNTLAVLIVGRKTGKTTFLKHCAVTWAKGHTSEPSEQSNAFFPNIHLVVFIDKNDEGRSWKETFLKAVKGTLHVKEQAWKMLQRDGQKVAIFVDELNGFTNPSVVEEMFNLVINRHCHMVIACRPGDECLKGRAKHFKLHAEILPLTLNNLEPFITNYAKAFIKDEHSARLQDMFALLNPLNEKGFLINQMIGYQKDGKYMWPQSKMFDFLATQWEECKRYSDGCWFLGRRWRHDQRRCGS